MIVAHLVSGVAPLAALPAFVAFGWVSAGSLGVFAWATLPILIALRLSSGGSVERAHLVSAAALAGLAALVTGMTGGLASPAVALFGLVLFEAGLAGSRRALLAGSGFAGAGLAGVALASAAGLAPAAPDAAALAAGGLVGALWSVSLAVRAALLVGTGERLRREALAEHDLVAGALSDLVTRHGFDGAATFASPAARALLGREPRELLGMGLFEKVHIADRPRFLQTLGAGGEATIRMRRSDGASWATIPVEMRARCGVAGEGAVATFRDVSERMAHEAELVAAREEAERASLAKTRFLASMSHELRTPLNAIIGFSEILSDDELCRLAPDRRADYAALIHRSGAHLLDVVNSIIDMARIESGAFAVTPEPCAVEPLVARCVGMMRLKAETAGLALGVEVAPDAATALADPRALIQVLLNLVSNAIKFTPKGGAVTVAARAQGARLALSVTDTGIGVAPEQIGRLGEAFFQADGGYGRSEDGAGLGLSVVRGLVALHGGEVTIESAVGRGTCVTVLLPRETDAGLDGRVAELAALARIKAPAVMERLSA